MLPFSKPLTTILFPEPEIKAPEELISPPPEAASWAYVFLINDFRLMINDLGFRIEARKLFRAELRCG